MAVRVGRVSWLAFAPGAWIVGASILALWSGALVAAGSARHILALIAAAAVFRFPTASLVALVLICQEVSTDRGFGAQFPQLALGNALYFDGLGPVPFIDLVVGMAMVGAIFTSRRVTGPRGLVMVVGVALITGVVAAAQGSWALLAIPLNVLEPFLLCLAGAVTIASTGQQPGGWTLVRRCAGLSVIGMSVWGLAQFAVFGAGRLSDGSVSVFFDSALPAAACAIGSAIALGRRGSWKTWAVLVFALALVAISGRRSVWIALVVLLVVVLLSNRSRMRMVLKLGLPTALVAAAMAVVVPDLLEGVGTRLVEATGDAGGSRANASVDGHAGDIATGLGYALDSPWLGYGQSASGLRGFVVNGPSLYVHNDVLYHWLLFGPLAALGLALLLLAAMWLGVRNLGDARLEVRVAACFLVIVPVCSMTAAFTMTTTHWPLLVGLALGCLGRGMFSGDPSDQAQLASRGTPRSAEADRVRMMHAQSTRIGDAG